MKHPFMLAAASWLTVCATAIADDDTGFPRAQAYRIPAGEAEPRIDGLLDEPVWDRAERIDEFHQIRPTDGGAPSERTEVMVAYDSDFIYFGVRAYDSEPHRVSAKALVQGQTFFSDDRFEIRLDTFNDRRNAYFFQVNPNGMRREARVGNDYFLEDWDTIWYADATQRTWGWSAEIAIPFRSLSFDPQQTSWGFNLSRVIPRKGEEVSWSSRERRLGPAVSGYLDDLSDMQQGHGIELVPSATLRYTDTQLDGDSIELEPSLTGFYRISPFLTGALTLNTDFSATEADARQVNLTRFSLFFPEKRDFFLRDAEIFQFADLETNGRPFFSRRIGLSSGGKPLDLEAGAKLTGRVGDWNVGALAVHQQPGTAGASENLLVARLSRNVFDESTVGIVATHGDPLSPRDNTLIGADFNFRDSAFGDDRTIQANAWFQRSDTDGATEGQAAFGAGVSYPNDRVSWSVEWSRFEADFNPALGFVNRTGVDRFNTEWRFRHRLDDSALQWVAARIRLFRTQRLDGSLQSQEFWLNLFDGFSNGNDFLTLFVGEQRENPVQAFRLFDDVTIDAGDYRFQRYGLFLETGVQRPLSGTLELVDGEFFDGTNLTLAPSATWRPNRHVRLGLDYRMDRIRLPGGDFTSRLYRGRADFALSNRLAWLNFVQSDNASRTVSINSRLRLENRPDREYFLVFNQLRSLADRTIIDTEIAFKARFNFRI